MEPSPGSGWMPVFHGKELMMRKFVAGAALLLALVATVSAQALAGC